MTFIEDNIKYRVCAWGKTVDIKDCKFALPIRCARVIAIYVKPVFTNDDAIPNNHFAVAHGYVHLMSQYGNITRAVIQYIPDVFERSYGNFDCIIKKEYRYYSLN